MDSVTSRPEMRFPKILQLYSLWSVVFTVLAVGTKLVCKYVLRLPQAYDFLVFEMQYIYIDFFCFTDRFKAFHHPEFFTNNVGEAHRLIFMYPAPAALFYEFFYIMPRPLFTYMLLMGGAVLCVGYKYAGALRRQGLSLIAAFGFVAICTVCSWPMIVNFFLANIEIVCGLLIGTGLYCFVTGRTWWAAALFGIAGAAKIFPLIFLALLFQKKQYRQIAFSLVVVGVLTVFCQWLLSGSVAVSQHGIAKGLENFRVAYALRFDPEDTGIDHSLFALLKGSIVAVGYPYPAIHVMARLLKVYLALTAVAGIALYFLRIQFLPVLNQVLCLCTIAVLFTPASHDYTLMHLYVPFGMMVLLLIETNRTGQKIPGLHGAFVCFALILSPLCEIMVHANMVGSQIKAIVLVVLLVIALRYRFVGAEQPTVYAPVL